jgi:hypothetical protein
VADDAHVIYNRYSDNLAPSATITIETGTAATGYDPENIADGDAAKPSKLNETSGAWLFDFGTATEIAIAALFHHNFEAGLDVRLQANASNSWGAPSLEVSFVIPAWRVDRFPGQPWIDLTGQDAFGAYRYWRLLVAGTNAVALAVGELWLGAVVRRLNPDFAQGRSSALDQPIIEHKTAYRRLRTPLSTTIRSISGTIPPTTDTVAQAVIDWITDAGGRPFLFIPDATLNEAWLALHLTTRHQIEALLDHDASTFPLSLEEDGRGLEPTPSPL